MQDVSWHPWDTHLKWILCKHCIQAYFSLQLHWMAVPMLCVHCAGTVPLCTKLATHCVGLLVFAVCGDAALHLGLCQLLRQGFLLETVQVRNACCLESINYVTVQTSGLFVTSQREYVNTSRPDVYHESNVNSHIFQWNLELQIHGSRPCNSKCWEQKWLVLVVRNEINLLSTLKGLQFYPSLLDMAYEHTNQSMPVLSLLTSLVTLVKEEL